MGHYQRTGKEQAPKKKAASRADRLTDVGVIATGQAGT